MKEKVLLVGTVLLLPALLGEALAFRCGSGLIKEGDKTGKVLIECGPPTHKEQVGKKTGRPHRDGRSLKEGGSRSLGKVERWYYNCGEHDFIYVLTFSDGVLKEITTEGYGKGKSDCRGRR